MIGRAEAAEAIARFTQRVPVGPVGLVIEGEPGIGKTTVWLEAVRMAGERGYRVLRATPAEAEADLSFAALGDLVGGVLDDVSDVLPPPQRVALDVALLRREADAPADPLTTTTGVEVAAVAVGDAADARAGDPCPASSEPPGGVLPQPATTAATGTPSKVRLRIAPPVDVDPAAVMVCGTRSSR